MRPGNGAGPGDAGQSWTLDTQTQDWRPRETGPSRKLHEDDGRQLGTRPDIIGQDRHYLDQGTDRSRARACREDRLEQARQQKDKHLGGP